MAQILSKVLDAILASRQASQRRVDNSRFNGQYLENCRGITGIIPADLKLIFFS
jgi:hypothetical protein